MSHSNSCKTEKRKVRAVTRIRPFFGKSSNDEPLDSCVVPNPSNPKQIAFHQQKYSEILEQTFNFDAVYELNSTQEEIFQNEVEPLVEHCLNGKKCTIFCYGPTGSGKTFTAFGKSDQLGIMARAVGAALDIKASKMEENADKNNNYECRICLSSLEIYNEKVYDLLSTDNINKHGLKVVQSGANIIVKDLIKTELNCAKQFFLLYNDCKKRRKTAFTALNAHSSRSHAIFTIYFEQTMSIGNHNTKTRSIKSKISIADLAGSENNKQTGNTGDRLRESSNINKSLLALGAVIDALNKRIKPPYRDSVLTRLLSDCLGGDSISTMVCCVSGEIKDSSVTRRCLEFGSNTRKIENKVIAHIENKENRSNNNNNSGGKRKNKRIDTYIHHHNKRRKLKHDSNTNNISSISSASSSSYTSTNTSFINDTNQPKRAIKYKIKPTPSKIIKDEVQLQLHEQIVEGEIMNKIDALVKSNMQQLMERKEESKEMSVYQNDKFGLPPSYAPDTANKTLAVYNIKKGRKYEIQGKIKKALHQYERAYLLLGYHRNLKKKIERLRTNLHSAVARQLSFDSVEPSVEASTGTDYMESEMKLDTTEHSNALKKGKQNKRRRKLKTKTSVELAEIFNNDSDVQVNDDAHDSDRDVYQLMGFAFVVNGQKLMDVMNSSTEEQLKSLKTIGRKKANGIIQARPFETITQVRKLTGLHTFKGWKNFIEGNEIIFKKA